MRAPPELPITFDGFNMKLKDYPHTDVMVIETNIAGWTVTKIPVDSCRSADILFLSTFDNMKLDRSLLKLVDNPLFRFGGHQIRAIGKVTLPVSFGDKNNHRMEHITFDVVYMFYGYNTIFGHGVTNAFSAVLHPGYLYMKLPAPRGIIAVYRDQNSTRIADDTIAPGHKNVHHLEERDKADEERTTKPHEPSRAQPQEETKQAQLFPEDPHKMVTISALLDSETEAQLI